MRAGLFNVGFKTGTTNLTPTLVKRWYTRLQLSPFIRAGRGHMAPHAPNTSKLGGWIPGNRSTFCTIFGARVGARFCDGKRPEARFIDTQVQYGESVTELGKKEKWQQA
jgi:hypothetical protein